MFSGGIFGGLGLHPQDGDGVAIGHMNDFAQQGVGMGLECQQQDEREPP